METEKRNEKQAEGGAQRQQRAPRAPKGDAAAQGNATPAAESKGGQQRAERQPKAEGAAQAKGGGQQQGNRGQQRGQDGAQARGVQQQGARQGGGQARESRAPAAPPAPPRLRDRYRNETVPALVREFQYKNSMQVPRVTKITLNVGLGEAVASPKVIESAARDITTIAGQKALVTKARVSIATFKLRAGMPIGVSVTLRGPRMWYFLDRLINVALPRIRDFRGIERGGFDGRGNFSLGLKEQIIFPEIEFNQIDKIRGFQVTVVTSAKTDPEALRLLELLGMPFVKVTA